MYPEEKKRLTITESRVVRDRLFFHPSALYMGLRALHNNKKEETSVVKKMLERCLDADIGSARSLQGENVEWDL